MPLFDVPGWIVPSEPVVEPKAASKKRKRASIDSTDSNLGKLVRKFRNGAPKSVLGKHEQRKRDRKAKALEDKKRAISKPMPLHFSGGKHSRADDDSVKSSKSAPPKKKAKTTKDAPPKTVKFSEEPPSVFETDTEEGDEDEEYSEELTPVNEEDVDQSNDSLTPLQKKMKESLDGARFRLINETLYKNDSTASYEMIKEDPQMFEDYHIGFRRQVQSWPKNPVNVYIKEFQTRKPNLVVADLGCGDAAIARALIPRGMSVISFDLVSDGKYVVEADICGRLPLPGSEPIDEKSAGEGHIVDVAICALSLMGTNWTETLREAWRILKIGGELKIAEVASRFTEISEFVSLVESIGFTLTSKDESNSHFTLFEFNKRARDAKKAGDWAKLALKGHMLKPCEYKRR